MDRAEQLEKIAKEYLETKFEESEELIRKEYYAHKEEVYQNLADVIHGGLTCCMQMRKKVKYIVVSSLESSNLTKSYELQVTFFNEKMYSDECPVYRYWKPMFIFSKVEEDMLFLKKKASEKVVRIKEYEMDPIRKRYLLNHYFQVLLFLRQAIPGLLENGGNQYDCLEQDAMVLWGKYMERTMLVYQLGERK